MIMNKKYMAVISASIAFIMVFVNIVSCNSLSENTAATDPATTEENKETIPEIIYENLDGYKFRVLVRNADHHLKDVYAEKENGDILNDAVFNRNITIEDKLNIKIDIIPVGDCDGADLVNKLRSSARAGTDDYDIALGHTHHIGAYAAEGELCNWLDIDNINYDNPWWN